MDAIVDSVGGWMLGGLVALGSIIGSILTRTVHLPGLHKFLPWGPPTGPGIISVLIEVMVVLLALSALGC